MLNFYKTVDNRIIKIDAPETGCWISVISPSEAEIAYLTGDLGVELDFVRAALDEEESSRIESEEDQTLVIVDYPVAEQDTDENNTILYTTVPMGIIMTHDYVITVCLNENLLIGEMSEGRVKGLQTSLKTRFLLLTLLRVAARFLQYLKQIDKISSTTEMRLHQSMRNKELIQLLGLEKSLVYFSTSLKSDEITLEKILRGRIIKLYEEDEDLLEDVLIEIKQAIEMCNIYSNILSGTMDAFASVISNNLNIVMKVLTAITIVMAIPNIVFGFYGMNVAGLPVPYVWMPLVISLVLCGITAIILVKKDMFKS
ncbi:magnesium transporter CorA family protein [Youxingia wuxianensis]|uniref:Magnesium transporter CorA family protein n=1 Tax=Youxingia wuxianensis TaxID=2763678 RepID=A0A926ERD8_9FIRM|nr:magnesium transporter CorA family protein [Youxingia wuxianensis]MBC8584905.1 magnesium transporter CorA family protein [Youxingia wuxianensis]